MKQNDTTHFKTAANRITAIRRNGSIVVIVQFDANTANICKALQLNTKEQSYTEEGFCCIKCFSLITVSSNPRYF